MARKSKKTKVTKKIKLPKIEIKRTIRTIDEVDGELDIVEKEDAGLPALCKVGKHDIDDELSLMDTYDTRYNNRTDKFYDEYYRSTEDKMGGIGLNYGDW